MSVDLDAFWTGLGCGFLLAVLVFGLLIAWILTWPDPTQRTHD